ncbi:chitobiase/beta-hexosaminidase C-terminal domain-containing protein [Archangium sp. Cb G35]|uniref:chitobiase/beta-hexosaminidase C-terminal domain-containing protein n=1 Tax=Archangium sp. Cb G35 TaxID=1920190 RepID=UPI000A76E0F0|nr:chitobiase/beta-hexosaminidase C-terminal domain-containing protein [Archangium sp. Cb G35]
MSSFTSWSGRLVLALLALQLASACNPDSPPPPPSPSDTTPPSTRVTPNGGAFKESVSVSLLCEDGTGSGCAATHYTTDGSTPSASSPSYSAPLVLSASTTLKFFSVDTAGNAEAVQTAAYVINTSPPVVSASPAGGTYRTPQSVTLSCVPGAADVTCGSIHYTLDGSTPTADSATYTTPLSVTADTTLQFFAVDSVGNASAVQREVYTIGDPDAPTTSVNPAGGTYYARQDITLTCADTDGSGCAGTYYTLDGSTPTTDSTRYSGPISLSSDTTLTFFSVDKAGNAEAARIETYVIHPDDTTAPTTTVDPAGGVYPNGVLVTFHCDDVGSGCAGTYYTLDGSTPTTGSTRFTGPISLSSDTTLKFFSVDKAGNAETPHTETYAVPTPASTSAQIANIRAKADGPINERIDWGLVTYSKPTTGSSDPAGFFLQAEKNGPAIFVMFDSATSGLRIDVGNRVNLVASEKTTLNGVVRISNYRALSVSRTGESVEPFRTDVSTVDLVAKLNDYDSELISITGTVASPFASAGSGHAAASFVTLGNHDPDPNLKLRLTTAVVGILDLVQGCVVTADAPLWRFNAQAQPSAWALGDLEVLSCPVPQVVGASAYYTDTYVTVTFDREIDPSSVNSDGSQFTFDNGLVVSSAKVRGPQEALLVTSPMVSGQTYKVTVASSVKDLRGSGVPPTANTASFTYTAPAWLTLTEVAPGLNGGKDLVELFVVKGGSVNNFVLMQGALILATFPDAVVATGDVIVVHLRPTTAPADAPASETTSKTEFPESTYTANYNSAWDFLGNDNEIGYSQRVLRVRDATGAIQDGAAFYRTSPMPPADFLQQLQWLQDGRQWLPANCGGVPCTDTTVPTAAQVSADWTGLPADKGTSVRRVLAKDHDLASDWAVGPSSFGSHAP